MPFAVLSRLRVYYEDLGSGRPIVLLHGFTLDHRMWQAAATLLAEQFRVIVPDARGHGRSDIPLSDYSRADRILDLCDLLDFLELEAVDLVGLSMGGSTAIGMGLQHARRLRSLTLVATGAAGYPLGKKLERLDQLARSDSAEAAKRTWTDWAVRYYADKGEQEIVACIKQMIADHSGALWADLRRGKYPAVAADCTHAPQIKTPVLLLSGLDDTIFVPLARELHRAISGSRLIEYESVGHLIPMEIPDRFTTDLRRFLESV